LVSDVFDLPSPYAQKSPDIIGSAQEKLLRAAVDCIDTDMSVLAELIRSENDPLVASHYAFWAERYLREGWQKKAFIDWSDNLLAKVEVDETNKDLVHRRSLRNRLALANVLLAFDHDFVGIEKLLEPMWKNGKIAESVPPDLALSWFNICLQTYVETGRSDRCEALLEGVGNGAIPLNVNDRFPALCSIAVYLPKVVDAGVFKQYLDVLETKLEVNPEPKELDQRNLRDIPLAFVQAELLRAWDKNDNRYEELRDDFLSVWETKEFELIQINSLKAKVFCAEGEAERDKSKLEAALVLYKAAGLDFHVAETELLMLELFGNEIAEGDGDTLLLKAWPVLERKLGGRGVSVFIEHLNRANNQRDKVQTSVFGGIVEFRPLAGIPETINRLAKVVFNRFYQKGDDAVEPLQRGLKQFEIHFSENTKASLEDKQARLLEAFEETNNQDALLVAALEVFGLESIEAVNPKSSAFDLETHEFLREAQRAGRPQKLENKVTFDADGNVQIYCQLVAIPSSDKNNLGWLLKSEGSARMSDAEIKLMRDLLSTPDLSTYKINREVTQPILKPYEWVKTEALPQGHWPAIESVYVNKFGFPPGADDDHWAYAEDSNGEYAVGAAVAPFLELMPQFDSKPTTGTPPELFIGCPNSEVFEASLQAALGRKRWDHLEQKSVIDSSVDMGTFAPRPPLDILSQGPPLTRFVAQKSHEQWGASYIIMIGHIMVRRALKQGGIDFAKIEIPEESLLSPVARDKKIIECMGCSEDVLAKWKKYYIDSKVLKPETLIIPIHPLIQPKA